MNRDGDKLAWKGSMLEQFARRGYQTAWVGKNHTLSDEMLAELNYAEIRRTLERQLSAWWPW